MIQRGQEFEIKGFLKHYDTYEFYFLNSLFSSTKTQQRKAARFVYPGHRGRKCRNFFCLIPL